MQSNWVLLGNIFFVRQNSNISFFHREQFSSAQFKLEIAIPTFHLKYRRNTSMIWRNQGPRLHSVIHNIWMWFESKWIMQSLYMTFFPRQSNKSSNPTSQWCSNRLVKVEHDAAFGWHYARRAEGLAPRQLKTKQLPKYVAVAATRTAHTSQPIAVIWSVWVNGTTAPMTNGAPKSSSAAVMTTRPRVSRRVRMQ